MIYMNRRNFLRTNSMVSLVLGLVPVLAVKAVKGDVTTAVGCATTAKNCFVPGIAGNVGKIKQCIQKYLVVYDDDYMVRHVARWNPGTAVASLHNFMVDTKERLEAFFPDIDADGYDIV